jgi:hypothetical protein
MYFDRPLFRTSYEELQEIDTRSEYIFWGHFSGVFRSVFLACATRSTAFCYRSLVDNRRRDFIHCASAASP